MELTTRTESNVNVIVLKGRFDAHEAPQVKTWLDQNIKEGNASLVVDLSGVNFVDSTALSTMVQAVKRCRQHGGDCRLSSMQAPVRVILELTRLDKAFAIHGDTSEAITALNQKTTAHVHA